MDEVAQRTGDERLMAGLAHAGILLNLFTNGLGGIVVALVIWLTQRDKAPWVGFQALQALVYQLLGAAVLFLSFMCWFAVWFGTLIPAMVNPGRYADVPPPGFLASFVLLCIPFTIGVVWTLYGLWGALRAGQGADFRYVVLGDILARQTGHNL
jgi:uncharacterized Tic20 family protein